MSVGPQPVLSAISLFQIMDGQGYCSDSIDPIVPESVVVRSSGHHQNHIFLIRPQPSKLSSRCVIVIQVPNRAASFVHWSVASIKSCTVGYVVGEFHWANLFLNVVSGLLESSGHRRVLELCHHSISLQNSHRSVWAKAEFVIFSASRPQLIVLQQDGI